MKQAKRILVTGGLGFIGFHLCCKLRREQPHAQITIVDNLSSTKINSELTSSLGDIYVEDFQHFNSVGRHYDEIYHLASPVGSLGILHSNGFVAHAITELAMKAADLAASTGAKLLYLSSSEVYGRDGQHAENSELRVPNLRGTRMEYALGKLTAEHILINRSSEGDFPLRIVRPFNVIGPWQSAEIGFVIPTFFHAALRGEALPVFGDGLQKRSFCLVDDLVSGMIEIQEHGCNKDLYNLGNPGNLITIKRLAETIIELCESSSSIQFTDPKKLHGEHYLEAFQKLPDITKAMKDTNWRPKADLLSALESCKPYYEGVAATCLKQTLAEA